MSEAPARRSTRTASTRERLYAAALTLIGTRGVDQVSVEEIAAEAGVAKGTVYYNFTSKDMLIEGLLEDRLDALIADLRAIPQGQVVHGAVETMLRFIDGNVALSQVVVAELWRPGSRWHDVLGRKRAEVIDTMEALFEAAATSDDRAAEGLSPRILAVGLLATSLASGLDWQVYTPNRPRAEITAQIVRLFEVRS